MNRPTQLPEDVINDRCAQEPIHIPGAIQPHGVLIAFSEPGLTVTQVSANTAELLGREPADTLGQHLEALLGAPQTRLLEQLLSSPSLKENNRLRLLLRDREVDGIVHRSEGVTILELEPRTTPDAPVEELLGRTLRRLQAARDLTELQDTAAREIRDLTGYDRVMLYRFDADGHGSVIAESLAQGLDPYLGLHYPASDIPKQARELYRRNWLRIIPDSAYTPVPLIPELRPDTGAPLDLSGSVLRSVSPVHREYLRNFGSQASLSISILRGDALWGLITCGNGRPRFVPYELRSACEAIGQLVSLQISALEELEVRKRWEARRGPLRELAQAMEAVGQDPLLSLAERPEALLTAVEASGAAVVSADQIRTVGVCPSPGHLHLLADWVRERTHRGVYSTHRLPAEFPTISGEQACASGLLALVMPRQERYVLLWFRPEVVQTVNWSGNPDKAASYEPETQKLHPRRSFELWKEQVKGQSAPWDTTDLQAAADLRRSVIEADLAHQVLREQAAVRARDELVAVVSHDLRNPIGLISLQATQIQKVLQAPGDPGPRLLKGAMRIQQATGRMAALLQDLVDLSKIEAGRFVIDARPENPNELLSDAVDVLAPGAESKKIGLSWSSDTTDPVLADSDRLFQVLSNLVGNAIKFTPEQGRIQLRVVRRGDWMEFAVSDTGPGIAAEDQTHLFERYWQSRQHRHQGTGLGLYISRGIVEAHGGRIWVESEPGAGTTFRFTLPVAKGIADEAQVPS
ncbi:MAG TPA: ATP-binding protein [Myxococcaceae bacterium]|nr:ATP-binding protein [Myxococcaceae bacterium]